MTQTKEGLVGNLFGAKELFCQFREQIEALWLEGEIRFTPAELDSFYGLLNDVLEAEVVIRDVADKFEQISVREQKTKVASPPEVGSLEEKIEHEVNE